MTDPPVGQTSHELLRRSVPPAGTVVVPSGAVELVVCVGSTVVVELLGCSVTGGSEVPALVAVVEVVVGSTEVPVDVVVEVTMTTGTTAGATAGDRTSR